MNVTNANQCFIQNCTAWLRAFGWAEQGLSGNKWFHSDIDGGLKAVSLQEAIAYQAALSINLLMNNDEEFCWNMTESDRDD